ncbi:hypothetical protein BCR42DRAFT_405992 [Absidia repens]|uniref:SEC7 domain-containing protein n=1 Tax=Absidia repens TaxID=90262 RepID=A0A1X2IU83_9FUNG|nr:hypothetical protein BCR42DRAFT_405992 [Absidia repens]
MNDDTSSSPTLTPTLCTGSPPKKSPLDEGFQQQVSSNKDVQAAFDQLTRKDASTKHSASPPSSFTQRLIDRGVPVPSFPSWERSRSINTQHSNGTDHDLSSSTGSLLNEFDSSNYYGLSPFVTSSFSANIPAINTTGTGTPHHNNGSNNEGGNNLGGQSSMSRTPQGDARYFSLRHRYERENAPSYQNRRKYLSQQQNHSDLDEEDDEDNDDMEDEDEDDQHNSSPDTTKLFQRHGGRLQHIQHEDSDIELSDDDLEKHSPGLAPSSIHSNHHLHHTVSSPLLWRTANGTKRKTEIGKMRSPSPLAPLPSLSTHNQDTPVVDDDDNAPAPPSSMEKFNKILAMKGYKGTSTTSTANNKNNNTKTPLSTPPPPPPTTTTTTAPPNKLARGGPRSHLLQTPVFEVVNANTIKDRYLFLFSDLLLICKPIMDENIIVGGNSVNNSTHGGQSDSRFRFRSNENSLFQVKNIVELSKLTLYLSQEDQQQRRQHQQHQQPPAPPRKMHPILASALRKFKSSAESGIAYLLDKQVLTLDPLSIANFLFKTPDLNRQRLGQYLGDRKHGDVYDAFLDCFRLVGLRLDEALRILLTTFRLPSQWEALEYVVERFAKKWHDANQNVVKFHEDMVVKVVVAMLFLNAEIWYDADSDKDVFWYARKQKENSDRQRLIRRATTMDQCRDNSPQNSQSTLSSNASSATRSSTIVDHRHQHHRHNIHRRESVAIEPLHYITALRESSEQSYRPSLHDFLDRWTHYDQYALVPREFMEEMYRSILNERLETGLDRRTSMSGGEDDMDGNEDTGEIINVIPHRLPTRLIKGVASTPITLSIPRPDPGLQIKLRGQDLLIQPNILDFSSSNTQSFTITGNTLGRTSMMFIKSGVNAGNYVSPTLPRTKALMVERHFMRYTFQLAFSHTDMRAVKAAAIKAARAAAATTTTTTTTTTSSDLHQKPTTTAGDESTNNSSEYGQSMDNLAKSPTSSLMVPPVEHGPDESDETLSSSAVEQEGFELTTPRKPTMVKRRYMFSVETEQEKMAWMAQLAHLCGNVVLVGGDTSSSSKTIKNIHNKKKILSLTAEERVALQVLKELLLADEIKKGTANVAMRTSTTANVNNDQDLSTSTTTALDNNTATGSSTIKNTDQGHATDSTAISVGAAAAAAGTGTVDENEQEGMATKSLKQQKKKDDATGADGRSSLISLSNGATNVVTKRVVQNSMVPFMLGFLRSQIE